MKKVIQFILLSLFFIDDKIVCLSSETTQFISDYMSIKHVGSMVASTCSLDESVEIMKRSIKNFQIPVLSKQSTFNEDLIYSIMASPYKIGIYINFTCDSSKYLFKKASELDLLTNRYSWLILADGMQSLQAIENYKFQLMSDVMYATKNEFESFSMFDIYKICDTWPLEIKNAGLWDKVSGINMTLNGSTISQRRNLGGAVVEGITVVTELNLTATKYGFEKLADPSYEIHMDKISRFSYVVFKNLEKIYNFTLNITFTDDWGMVTPNSLRGMNVDLAEGKAELGVSLTTISTDKLDVLDFSCISLWKFRSIFTLRSPSSMGSPDALILPFSISIWICILLITLAITILMSILKFYSIPTCSDKSFSGNLIEVVGSFFQQGFSSCSCRLSERIILFTTLVCGMMTCLHFSSMIVTALIRPVPISIASDVDLANSRLKIAVHDIPYFHKYFKDTQVGSISWFYKKKKKETYFVSIKKGVELVKQSSYAFYTEESYQYPLIENTFTDSEICTLSEVELYKPYMVPSPMRKHTPLRKFVNCGLILMKEVGILSRETNQWKATQPKCYGSVDYTSVQYESLTVAYIVYVTGFILSIVILLLERCAHKKQSSKRKVDKIKTRRFVILNKKKI